jgi:hypothetical protein
MHVVADLLRRHAAVRVHHHDEVAGGRQEPGAQRAAFSRALLGHDSARPAGIARAVITVTSVELPSTRMISSTSSAICSSTQPTLRASFLTGITRLTLGRTADFAPVAARAVEDSAGGIVTREGAAPIRVHWLGLRPKRLS